eukprot:1078798-Amphidinium_carterae.1
MPAQTLLDLCGVCHHHADHHRGDECDGRHHQVSTCHLGHRRHVVAAVYGNTCDLVVVAAVYGNTGDLVVAGSTGDLGGSVT